MHILSLVIFALGLRFGSFLVLVILHMHPVCINIYNRQRFWQFDHYSLNSLKVMINIIGLTLHYTHVIASSELPTHDIYI